MTLSPAASTLTWNAIVLFAVGGDLRFGRERVDLLLQSLQKSMSFHKLKPLLLAFFKVESDSTEEKKSL